MKYYYYAFGGVLMLIIVSATFTLGVYYLYNPEVEIRQHTIRLLSSNPHALRIIGGGKPPIRDITPQVLGSRSLQAHHRWPYVGQHCVEMTMVVTGSGSNNNRNKKTFVFVQMMKEGSVYKPIYLHLDTERGRVVILDHRR